MVELSLLVTEIKKGIYRCLGLLHELCSTKSWWSSTIKKFGVCGAPSLGAQHHLFSPIVELRGVLADDGRPGILEGKE
jgi:hypothetical protein